MQKILEKITKRFIAFQNFSKHPIRFRVSVPSEDELVFGSKLSQDIMFLKGKAVLHVVHTATHFLAETFLDSHGPNFGQSAQEIRLSFVMTLCLDYADYPDRLRTGQGSVFTFKRWKQLTDLNGFHLCLSGIESRSSLGTGERCYAPSRRFYCKIKFTHPTIEPQYLLKIAVKAMNDTMVKNELVPFRLFFGIISRFPILTTNLPEQKERMEAVKAAQAKIITTVAQRRVFDALIINIPPAANRSYKIREADLHYSELKKKWIEPLTVISAEERTITVKNKDNSMRKTFNSFHVKPLYNEFAHNFHVFRSTETSDFRA